MSHFLLPPSHIVSEKPLDGFDRYTRTQLITLILIDKKTHKNQNPPHRAPYTRACNTSRKNPYIYVYTFNTSRWRALQFMRIYIGISGAPSIERAWLTKRASTKENGAETRRGRARATLAVYANEKEKKKHNKRAEKRYDITRVTVNHFRARARQALWENNRPTEKNRRIQCENAQKSRTKGAPRLFYRAQQPCAAAARFAYKRTRLGRRRGFACTASVTRSASSLRIRPINAR